jgi:hypothetical protein
MIGLVGGFYMFSYALDFMAHPTESIQSAKKSISEIFGNSASEIKFPDCQTEMSKTVVLPSGNSYTISCTPK